MNLAVPNQALSSPVVKLLLLEHVQLHRVLHLIERELERAAHYEQPDFDLLRLAIEYMREFPGKLHHPQEELLFDLLVKCDVTVKPDVDRLRQQHRELYQLEDNLREMTALAAAQGQASYPRLLEFGRRYLRLQNEHAAAEEKSIFPRTVLHLHAGDWKLLESRYHRPDDPLFGSTVRDRFRLLYQRLIEQAQTPTILRH